MRNYLLMALILSILLLSGCASNVPNSKAELYPHIYNMHEHLGPIAVDKMSTGMKKANISKILIVGSPNATLYKNAKKGFNGYDKNNQEILDRAKNNPMIIPFCTIWPLDEQKLIKFKGCMKQGSRGLKLYSGHSALFYDSPLNISSMEPVYKYLEDNDIPIVFHVNPGNLTIMGEFEDVLNNYPNLRVICPHFCLSSINTSRFEYLMDKYSNLYTDISFGFFVNDGLKRISDNAARYSQLMEKYQDRVFFATDMVVTSAKYKTEEWIYNLTMCYRDMLEKEKYICKVGTTINSEFNGLNLSNSVLYKIYYQNPKKFLKDKVSS